MPKRECPFSESNRPQLKTHIGLQELSMGVLGLDAMSTVYDRTLKLMYQNSRGHKEEHKENMMDSSCNGNMTIHTTHILPGQRKLNLSGQFDGYYSKTADERVCEGKDQFMPIACVSCRNIPSVARVCDFCERCLCEYCCRDCHTCGSIFCSDCSTIRVKPGEEDKYTCFSCV